MPPHGVIFADLAGERRSLIHYQEHVLRCLAKQGGGGYEDQGESFHLRNHFMYHAIQAAPRRIVIAERGAPTRKYSQNPILTFRRACWTTIRLATEPRMVRLPANVEDIARVNQARWGFARCPTKGLNTSTAGTLLAKLESNADRPLNRKTLSK